MQHLSTESVSLQILDHTTGSHALRLHSTRLMMQRTQHCGVGVVFTCQPWQASEIAGEEAKGGMDDGRPGARIHACGHVASIWSFKV